MDYILAEGNIYALLISSSRNDPFLVGDFSIYNGYFPF